MNPVKTPFFDLDADGRLPMNCMTLIAGRNASASGCVMVGHNEDDPGHLAVRHGYVPAAVWPEGSTLPAETGCAAIPQVSHTLGYAWTQVKAASGGLSTADAFLNECGVLITSNSMGGSREDGEDPSIVRDGGIGYGLRRALAERAQSARDGIRILIELVETWGYASSGRAYTIADRDEAFMIQLVRGRHYLGARIPDDAIAVMPNHYTFHTLHDCPEMFYPDDLVAYAVSKGWYTPAQAGDFSDFDFAKAYQAEENYLGSRNVLRQKHGLRLALDRAWDVEREGMPFCVPAGEKMTVGRMAGILSTHYEGTCDDCERFGPGRSPHDTPNVRRICTGTTLESFIVDFAECPPLTTVYIALGRPCELPYLALHPLLGIAAPLDTMDSPSREMAVHLHPDERLLPYTGEAWQRLRNYESLAEMLYGDVQDGIHAMLAEMLDRAQRENGELIASARQRLSAGETARAFLQVREADSLAVLRALSALEAHAASCFRLAETEQALPISLSASALTLRFRIDGKPAEDSLLLALCHTDTRQRSARALPGTLRRVEGERWEAVFNPTALCSLAGHPGLYACCLGGQAGGRAFAAPLLLELTI